MVERVEGVSAGQSEVSMNESDLQVAQSTPAQQPAGTPEASQPDAAAAEGAHRTVVAVEEGNVVRLPADSSIDQPRVNGTDLEFVQPDGSVIVVPNGAVQGLTIMIGAVEIPPQTVAALFAANDIQTAAGPSGGDVPGSGGNFEVPVGGIGDALPIGSLLPPTELAFGNNLERPLYEGLEDTKPTAGANGMALLDDDDLLGGNPGGLGDDLSGPLTGTLVHDYGNNGVGSLLFTGATFPAGLGFTSSVSPDGLVLTVSQNGTAVMRITLGNTTSGAYTIEQLAPIHHPGAGEDNVVFDIAYRVTDSDGDFIDGSMSINVDDDTPTVTLDLASSSGGPGVAGIQLALDETFGPKAGDGNAQADDANGAGFSSANLTNNVLDADTKAFGQMETATGAGGSALAALFASTVSLGADGGTVAHQFALSLTGGQGSGVATNLVVTEVPGTALDGLSVADRTVYLFTEADGSITGRIGGSNGLIALHISLNGATDPANVSLVVQQLIPVSHGDVLATDESLALSLTGGGNNAALGITYTVTATDGDGDVASQTASVTLADSTGGTGVISFDDDGPTLTVGVDPAAGLKGLQVSLDETIGTDRANGTGEVANGNTDDDPTPPTDYLGQVTTTIGGAGLASLFTVGGSFGADGGSDSAHLSFIGIPAAGVATNLSATVGGAITLFQVNDTTLEGRTAGGTVVFDIQIVNGQLQTTLHEAIAHTDNNLFDASAMLELQGNAGPIQLQYSVIRTDGDGDSVTQSAAVDIITTSGSYFSFDDDGPQVTAAVNSNFSLTHDETLFAQSGTNDANVLDALSLIGQFAGVSQPGHDPQTLGLPIGLAQSTVAAVTVSSVDYGADGAASAQSLVYGFSLTDASGQIVTGPVDSGLQTTEHQSIYLFVENGLVVGRTGTSGADPAAFALNIDPQTGRVTLIQYLSLAHGDATNDNDLVSLDHVAGALNATVTVTDGDGDHQTVAADIGAGIHFRDDAPTGFNATSLVELDDEAQSLFSGNPGPLFGGDAFFDFASTAGLPGSLFYTGVDGIGTITLSTAPDFSVIYKTANGLAAQQGISWNAGVTAPDGSVTFTAQGQVTHADVATLVVGADGSYVFTMLAPIAHANGGGENNENLTFGLTVTDGDGDSTAASLKISVDDDTPVGHSVRASAVLDDDAQGLFAGNDTPDDHVTNINTTSGNAGSLFSAGADGVSSVDLATQPALSVIYKDGDHGIPEPVTWVKTVDPVTGTTTFSAISAHYPVGSPAAVLVVGTDGSYTFTLNAPVAHSVPQTSEGNLSLRFDVRVTDGDGDTDSATLTVRVNDDTPIANSGASIVATVDEDGLTGANIDNSRPGEAADSGSATYTSASGALTGLVHFGADGLGSFSVKAVSGTDSGVNSKGADVLVSGSGTTLYGYAENGGGSGYQAGVDRLVFTLTVNPDGTYTFTLNDQIDHPTLENATGDNTENLLGTRIDLSNFLQATDGDGDPVALASGSFQVDVRDDIPVITARDATTTTITETETLTFALKGGNDVVGGITTNSPKGVWVTGEDLSDTDDTANTSHNAIGIGDGQIIDGQGQQGHTLTGPEVLKLEFFENVNIPNGAGVPSHGASYDVNSVRFSIDAAEAGGNDDGVVFIQVLNNGAVVSPSDYTLTMNGQPVPAGDVHEVYSGGTLVGFVFENVPDNAGFEITSAAGFDAVKIGNYNGYAFEADALGNTITLSSGNSFKVYGLEAGVDTVTTVPETFAIAHDESAGVNTAADPNPASDVDGTGAPALLAGAFGYARSATSVLDPGSLFHGSVGADENGTYSFSITDANGNPLVNVASGLKTTSGVDIVLSTDANGVLVGSAGGAVAFKVMVDASGSVWIAQYLPIDHSVDGTSNVAFDDIATVSAALHITGTLTDFDGDSVSTTSPVALKVEFQDDGPVVLSDTNSVIEDGAPATGNVVTNDAPGTDGVGSVAWDGDNGSHVINGQYGQLTVDASGNYTYTLYTLAQNPTAYHAVQGLNPNQSLSEQFDYTLTDGDGDSVRTALTITVNGADDIVTISGIGNLAGDVVVDEKGLPTGSDAPGNSEVATGTFSFDAPDGLQSVTIEGATFTLADLQNAGVTPLTAATTATGTLQIIGYTATASGGTVSYRFTLTDNLTTHTDTIVGTDGDSDRGAADQVIGGTFAVEVKDSNGSTASSSITVAVNDDGPTASSVTLGATEGQQPLTGVLPFVAGADGAIVSAIDGHALTFDPVDGWSQSFSGSHGTLRVKANGEYEYQVQPDDQVISGGTDTFGFTVTDGDNDTSQAAITVTVADTIQTNFITLDDVNVTEAQGFVYTAQMTYASPTPMSITLSNGVVVNFAAGSTTGSSAPQPAQGDDPYVDGASVPVSIVSYTGGNFEAVDITDTATVTITDTTDTTVVTLNDVAVLENQQVVYTASVNNAPQTAFSVTLSNGVVVNFGAGSTTGSSAPQPAQGDDPYVDGVAVPVSIVSYTGGNFEAVDITDTATVTITDTTDTVTVKLSATTSTSEDGGSIVYTAGLVDGSNNPVTAHNAITVTLANGETITIAANASSGDSAPVPVNQDDVYLETDSIANHITGVSEANAGQPGAFENLQHDATPVATTITDDSDAVTATLTAGAVTFDGTGANIAYTITLSGGPGVVTPTNGPLTFTLTDGTQIVVPQGAGDGTVTVHYDFGTFTSPITNAISSVSGDDEYEHLATAGSTSVTANTVPTVVDGSSVLTVQEAALDVVKDGDDLAAGTRNGSNPRATGETATDAAGLTFHATGEAITSVVFADPTVDVPAIANLGSGTAQWDLSPDGRTLTLSFGGQAALILALTGATGAAAGSDAVVGVTATLVDGVAHQVPNSVLDVILSDIKVVATDASGDPITGTVTVNIVDDAPVLGAFINGVIPNETGSISGLFSLVTGADGIDHFDITGPAIPGITYTTTTASDGTTVLHGNSGATEIFTLTVAPDGTYEFDLVTPQLGTTVGYDATSLPAGGPDWRQTDDGRIEFSSAGGINSNSNGFGVANPFTGGNESFTMEFHTPGQDGDQTPDTNPEFNDKVTLKVVDVKGGGGQYDWTAVDTVHNVTRTGHINITAAGDYVIDPSISFNQLTITAHNVSGQGIQITTISVTKYILPADQSYDFHITAVDGDGDRTATQTLHIDQVAAGDYSDSATAINVVLDAIHPSVIGSAYGDNIAGGSEDNIIAGGGGGDNISSGAGNDTIYGGAGDDNINGGTGNDTLMGDAGNDILTGGDGDDILIGGLGNDQLSGGAGNDTFKFAESGPGNVDTITDYLVGDTVDLSDLLPGAVGNEADVRFKYADGSTKGINDAGGGADGDVTIQVQDNTGWHDVAVIKDNGSNLTSSAEHINLILDDNHTVTIHTI